MKKVLFVATVVRLHLNLFHLPYLRWFHDQGWQVDVAANNDYENPEDCVIPCCDHHYVLPFERSPFKKGNLEAYRQLKELLDLYKVHRADMDMLVQLDRFKVGFRLATQLMVASIGKDKMPE